MVLLLIAGLSASRPLAAQTATLAAPAAVLSPTPGEREKTTTVPDTAAVKALIKEGTALHDQGKYDAAIDKYRAALKLDPDSVDAMYEMAYSQYARLDLKTSLATASEAAKRPSPLRSALYGLIGNIYDDLKEPAKAIEAYQAGLRENPNLGLLHFNLGVTYRRLNVLPKARASFQNGLSLEPNRASSHYWLGRTYMEQGYRVPAILALSRFLVLEPASQRSKVALDWIDEIFHAEVKTDTKGNSQLTVLEIQKDEGDFTAANLMISLLQASEKLPTEADEKPEAPFEVKRLADLFSVVAETRSEAKGMGFAETYYVPYFVGLKEGSWTETFAYYILQSGKTADVEKWLATNRHVIDRMLRWSSGFKWNSAKSPGSAPEPRPAEKEEK